MTMTTTAPTGLLWGALGVRAADPDALADAARRYTIAAPKVAPKSPWLVYVPAAKPPPPPPQSPAERARLEAARAERARTAAPKARATKPPKPEATPQFHVAFFWAGNPMGTEAFWTRAARASAIRARLRVETAVEARYLDGETPIVVTRGNADEVCPAYDADGNPVPLFVERAPTVVRFRAVLKRTGTANSHAVRNPRAWHGAAAMG